MRMMRAGLLATLLFPTIVNAQQTGVVVATAPGMAARTSITVRTIVPVASCETEASDAGGEVSSVPELIFGRKWNELICIRHKDGKTEELTSTLPKGIVSSDGKKIAYWSPARGELHVFSTADRNDAIVDMNPGAKLRELNWSLTGHTLTYLAVKEKTARVRAFDLDSGKQETFQGNFNRIAASADSEHATAVGPNGIVRLSLVDGTKQLIAKVNYPNSAEYSSKGNFLGILASAPLVAVEEPGSAAESDDEMDCRGGAFFLIVQNAKTGKLTDIRFPKGFETVLDFSFSPDEKQIAVTFGVRSCDYPGDRAQIFTASIADFEFTAITQLDRLSVKPVWTPDGRAVVYSDYSGSEGPLVSFDIASRRTTTLTKARAFGPDEWLGWR